MAVKYNEIVGMVMELYLKLIRGYPVNGHLNTIYSACNEKELPKFDLEDLNPDGTKNISQNKPGQMLSHIVMRTPGDSIFWGVGYSDYVPWVASQLDILAEDWFVVLD